jgi:hypothetical protein
MGAQSFHQYLEADRLRCTLVPSQAAVWRIKRTKVRLSALAACTLANANLLDFQDLKLYRAQEYYTDEGPRDPISGAFTTACRAFSSMGMGLAELPSETVKALQITRGFSRQHSQASVPTIVKRSDTSHTGERSTPRTSAEQTQTSLNVHNRLARVRTPPNLDSLSASASEVELSSMSDALQGDLINERDDAHQSQPRIQNAFSSSKDHGRLRQNSAHMSKGLGRFTKTLVQSPMELSVGITRGFHNVPKLWGDDTVRPQERISDLKSGIKAGGKEFGFGWYDGVTGLFTQPWNGAQKDGTSGFIKGIGKGIGGFIAKPGAAMFGVLGYSMKGVHKEVQKLFGSNVQNYIITSRVAQGYEEWLLSSDAQKQDVIVRWKLIQKYLKKKQSPDEMVGDVLEAQRKMNTDGREARQTFGHTETSAQSVSSANAPKQDPGSAMLATGGSQSSMSLVNTATKKSLEMPRVNAIIQSPVQEISYKDDANMGQLSQENVSQLQRRQQEAVDDQADENDLREAIALSEAEGQRHANEALEYEKQLDRIMAQSLREQRERASDSDWGLGLSPDEVDYKKSEQART